MADHLRKYESLFTLTPQRMRMIVEAFKETLELGLQEPNQVVVCIETPSLALGGIWLLMDTVGDPMCISSSHDTVSRLLEITRSNYSSPLLANVIVVMPMRLTQFTFSL